MRQEEDALNKEKRQDEDHDEKKRKSRFTHQ